MMGVILFMIYVNRDEIEGKFSVNIALLTNEDGMPYESACWYIKEVLDNHLRWIDNEIQNLK